MLEYICIFAQSITKNRYNMITKEFLKSRLFEKSFKVSGNVYTLSKRFNNIVSFSVYNILKSYSGDMDGHYTFVVDIETFNYVVFKHADYGGLTWVVELDGINRVVINDLNRKFIEGTISYVLLTSMTYNVRKQRASFENNYLKEGIIKGNFFQGWCCNTVFEIDDFLLDSYSREISLYKELYECREKTLKLFNYK